MWDCSISRGIVLLRVDSSLSCGTVQSREGLFYFVWIVHYRVGLFNLARDCSTSSCGTVQSREGLFYFVWIVHYRVGLFNLARDCSTSCG